MKQDLVLVCRKTEHTIHDGLTGRQDRQPVNYMYKVYKSSKPQ